jgi:hypothetical protein
MRKAVLFSVGLLITLPLHADDGAASISAGGIILMKREPRISMAKEVLQISPSKIIVDYDFRNDSDEDITTGVAFPIPPFSYEDRVESYLDPGFDDFRLLVNGLPTKFQTETRAYIDKRDITALLASHHVDAATFGHTPQKIDQATPSPDIERGGPALKKVLSLNGAIKDGDPNWRVEEKYYWKQTFPALSVTHIRHEYTPRMGNSNSIGDPKDVHGRQHGDEYASVCPDKSLQDTLANIWNQPRKPDDVPPLWITYVDFILTTANTWKTPIEDFTLNVERPSDPKHVYYVSFCWDGPVTKVDADHFTAHVNGLLPTKELRIGYIVGNAQKK